MCSVTGIPVLVLLGTVWCWVVRLGYWDRQTEDDISAENSQLSGELESRIGSKSVKFWICLPEQHWRKKLAALPRNAFAIHMNKICMSTLNGKEFVLWSVQVTNDAAPHRYACAHRLPDLKLFPHEHIASSGRSLAAQRKFVCKNLDASQIQTKNPGILESHGIPFHWVMIHSSPRHPRFAPGNRRTVPNFQATVHRSPTFVGKWHTCLAWEQEIKHLSQARRIYTVAVVAAVAVLAAAAAVVGSM